MDSLTGKLSPRGKRIIRQIHEAIMHTITNWVMKFGDYTSGCVCIHVYAQGNLWSKYVEREVRCEVSET